MNKTAAIAVALLASGAASLAQGDPDDTPAARALSALLPVRDDALYARWLQRRAEEAKFASWLEAQRQAAAKAVFASYLGRPELLLGVMRAHDRPNYNGNAFEPVRRSLWLDVARGEPLPKTDGP